ncbi:Gfo/Idh/MocA family oxidoreductase [Egicoccus halophilus]|uniref:Oxidoreductase n=1 Tax=Egicoccus halophilus TaxID=1670830 RepID=A0A8J3AG90_9ACTN|nr:Gfo/Idh/MocA family oxidoreductase [Egicoccus halophilus]GGI07568.1 hypothetical protein GCM10011354_24740 [Egicoccus halophilus]
MKVLLAGEGAIGQKHLQALQRIEGVEVVGLAGGEEQATARVAAENGIPHWSIGVDGFLDSPEIEAVVLATPTPLHADQAVSCLQAGKHVLIEIPVAESLADAERVATIAREAERIAMVCHTRRFNPGHRWLHARIATAEFRLQHLLATTVFLRRENRNALGQPRSWTDHLLWHHACHTVDLFVHQTGQEPDHVWALQGPIHPELGIAMDMSVGLANDGGAICTLALSFNHDGPLGTRFCYIGDTGTYTAFYDDLKDGFGNEIDLGELNAIPDGIEVQDREFVASILERRMPASTVSDIMPTMRTLDRLDRALNR